MRITLQNEDGIVTVHKFFPFGGLTPTGIKVSPGEVILIDVKPGEVIELARQPIQE